ncbi:polysaccharide biosynthesis tyrosine autokinase [Actinoplanes sp. NBC_00393]|uniref:polysaccharide biosynthesis tyrosine autokinase n=1 Tax=Actinoplanes sp. NBC_00393 TaxID=2975953 RepID=UPI002E22C213
MTIYGRSARLLRRYGPWTLVVTAATVAAAYGVNQSLPADYRSEATVLVEARVAAGTTPVQPNLDTERAVALSEAVVLPAAQRIGMSASAMLDGFEVEVVPGADVLTFVYSANNQFSAQVRTRALVEAYLDYRKAGTVATPTLISPASLPSEPDTRPLVPDLAAGLVVGLLLGAGTALLRSLTRSKIRSREDFERLSKATVLATVPRTKRPAGTATGLPVVLRQPGSPAAESYRYLRTRLQPVLRPTSATTLLVTSATDRDGRTTVAANLAVVLAQAGRSVVLIDADLRRPVLHNVFQVPGEYGLTTLLDGDATVSEVLEDTSVPRLRLLPAGHRNGEHVDLLESPQLARVLRAVQKHCDVVILDSAAVLSASDAIALATLSDQVLLVGDFRHTKRGSVQRAMAELAEVVEDNVSAVLLNVPKSAGGLAPHARELSGASPSKLLYGQPNGRLKADAEDVAPPGITSHLYIEAEEEDDEPEEQVQEEQARPVVPVIYGAPVTPTVYSSSAAQPSAAAAVLEEPTALQPIIEEPAARVEEPSTHVEEPTALIEEPSTHVEEPTAYIEEPATHVDEPTAHLEEPTALIEEPSEIVEEPSTLLVEERESEPDDTDEEDTKITGSEPEVIHSRS